MKRFYGTIEYLPGGRTAIVALHDARGDWFGAQRIELPRRGYVVIDGRRYHGKQALYEQGYTAAAVKAAAHGGSLDTFKAVGA